MTVTNLPTKSKRPTKNKPFFELIDECQAAISDYVDLWKVFQASHAQGTPDSDLYDKAGIAHSKAKGLTWAVFDNPPDTLEGVLAQICIQKQLTEMVDADELEFWPHQKGWLERIRYNMEQLIRTSEITPRKEAA